MAEHKHSEFCRSIAELEKREVGKARTCEPAPCVCCERMLCDVDLLCFPPASAYGIRFSVEPFVLFCRGCYPEVRCRGEHE